MLPRYYDESGIKSPETQRVRNSYFRRLERRYPDNRINEYTPDMLRDFILLDDDGAQRTTATGTAYALRTALRSFFSWAHYVELTPTDPAVQLNRQVRIKVRHTKQHVWLSAGEINGLFAGAVNGDRRPLDDRDDLVIGFGVMMGLRLSEIVGVRWSHLNFFSKTLSVLGKGQKLVTLPVPPQMLAMLTAWRDGWPGWQPTDPVLYPYMRCGSSGLFQTVERLEPRYGHALGVCAATNAVKARGALIGVPALSPHDLRRSYAGLLEDNGVSLREIQTALRHSDISTTERYLADNPAKWRDNVTGALGGIIVGGSTKPLD